MADTIIDPELETTVSPFYVLAVGRIVHYINGWGKHCAAIVTNVRSKSHGLIDLTVFGGIQIGDNHLPEAAVFVENVSFGAISGTWHWPERVGE